MKYLLTITITSLLVIQNIQCQEKIKADLKIINFLGKIPYKTERNSQTENLLRILYFKPQPKEYSKIGFLDSKGKIKIKPLYSMASDFYNGYSNVIKDSVYGYIDTKGKEILFEQYQETYFYYGATGIARKGNKFGLIDRKGNQLTDFKYGMIYFFGFNHYKATIAKNEYHILDNKGKIVFNENLEYNIKSDYFEKDSLLVYEKNIENKNFQGLVSLDNKIITKPLYEKIYFIGDEDYYIIKKDKKYGFINKLGVEIIPPIYNEVAFNITQNLIAVKLAEKWGYINKKNQIKIPFEYDEAYPFFDGIAFVKKEKLYECINKNNKVIFKTIKPDTPFYSDNLSLTKEENKYGYMNKKGKMVIPTKYDYAYPFVDGLAYVELSGKAGFINNKGEEVIPLKYNQLWLESEKMIRFVE